ncbi:MAG: alpha-galactosidase [bacterium]
MLTATGIESDRDQQGAVEPHQAKGVERVLSLSAQHLRLTQVTLADQTDHHNELVQERQWLLHPSESGLLLHGNLFVIENLAAGSGHILVKKAPLPGARSVATEFDLKSTPRRNGGYEFVLSGSPEGQAHSWEILEYHGGLMERTRVIHEWQRRLRPATPGHWVPRFLSNTWGDRSRDSRIREDFVAAEIDAAHLLGVEVVQIDDGWQRGVTSNSSLAQQLGGVWEGFWNADPHFWDPHPERFSQGLGPIVERARAKGMSIGLWFAPDSWNEFANWRRDADCILKLFSTLGIEHFKIDGVSAKTELAFCNLDHFFQAVLDGSQGRVVFDLDITADIRPGYFGAMEVGPIFVENRYTDWHKYWPHQTLRNLWMLSHWVDPRRLRMEFLSNARNVELYSNDPLAPSRYTPATLFATVMFSNPLGWFEVSALPAAFCESVAGLVKIWKTHREALFSGSIIPIGKQPDGFSVTGFLSLSEAHDSGYVLIFRELYPEDHITLVLPAIGLGECQWDVLAPGGAIQSQGDILKVQIPNPLGFVFARFTVICASKGYG